MHKESFMPRSFPRPSCTLLVLSCALGLQPACYGFATKPAPTVSTAHGTPVSGIHDAPIRLRADDLATPLGIDDATPHFSWQLVDTRHGARQTAYEIQVASTAANLLAGRADIWDSGRVSSDQSVAVPYNGPALAAMTRYYWRVLAWDQEGKPYTPSQPTWWETGLMSGTKSPAKWSANWSAKWIGSQTPEEFALRAAHAAWITTPDPASAHAESNGQLRLAYRFPFAAGASAKHVILYLTGQDVASAWVNGKPVATGAPLPPWKQLPWKKYVRLDITDAVHSGQNLLAIETIQYQVDPKRADPTDAPPMSATLLLEAGDGAITSYATGTDTTTGWRVSTHPQAGWSSATRPSEDASWLAPVSATPAARQQAAEPLGDPWPAQSVKALRHTFAIHQPIVSARLYVTALGAYQFFVNGHPAGDQILSPGWTDNRLRLVYQTYDVTAHLLQGENALGALLAPGWYSTPLQWFQQPNVYGQAPPSLLAQLRIVFADGSVQWIVTDQNWQASQSPILKAEIYDGETEDARLEQPNWNTVRFDAAHWTPAEIHHPDLQSVVLEAQNFEPIRVERLLTAKSVSEPRPGVFLYDFGQNFAGVERIPLSGPRGATVRVRTGEILNSDGSLYTDNLRTAKSTDKFILSGHGTEIFQPRFTFHGFRYLEITGLAQKLPLDQVVGVVFHTDAAFAVQLKTGSDLLNKLWSNILWGQRSNFVGVPTDCPQRDERLGWTADAQVFWRAASYNMQLAAFSRKYTADIRGTQTGSAPATDVAGSLFGIYAPGVVTPSSQSGAGWSDAGVIIPWTSWIQTGDTTILEQNWPAMTRYLDAIERTNPDSLWTKNAGISFGDWLSPEGPTKYPLVATAYWAYDVTLMRQMAHALGKTDDELRYRALFEKIQTAYQAAFVHPDGFIPGASAHGSGMAVNNPNLVSQSPDTQTGYVLTLAMHLVPDAMRQAVADQLVRKIHANHDLLATGFLGTPYLLAVLTDTGHADLAYRLLLNTQYPSWGYLVDHDATTMWERWNGDQMKGDPSMNSYNHYAYGAVADWVYRYAAGIDASPLDAGFHTILLHPAFSARLGSLDLRYPSPYGEIQSNWRVAQGKAYWHLTIPANSQGWLPLDSTQAARFIIHGKPIPAAAEIRHSTREGQAGFLLPAGDYSFLVTGVIE